MRLLAKRSACSPENLFRAKWLRFSVRSGRIIELDEFLDPLPANRFRTERERTRYRLDAGYSFRKDVGADKLLLLRLGLYNIVGNPSEEEVLSYYSVHWYGNCLPYA